MGEITINPINNVHKKYRQMNFVNPYRFGSPILPFISTWKTDNTSTGSSTATQIKLQLVFDGTYNFTVKWGDGTQSTITTYNQAETMHTYSVAGTYSVTITGILIGWKTTTDVLKILSIQSWGSFRTGNNTGVFGGCSNLTLTSVSDVLNLTGVTTLNGFVGYCTALTTINNFTTWNTSAVTDFSGFFIGCTNYNQNLNALNVSSCAGFSGMFQTCYNFNNGGVSSIGNWALKTTGTIDMYRMFYQATKFNQPLNWNTIAVTTMQEMFFGYSMIFNQNLGVLNISNVTNMSGFMTGHQAVNMSASNIDNTYIGWAALPSVKPNITITFEDVKRTSASTSARLTLTSSPNNWVITDGGI